MPFALTSRVWALTSEFTAPPRTRTGRVAITLSRERRSTLDFINPTCHSRARRGILVLERTTRDAAGKHRDRSLSLGMTARRFAVAFDSIDQTCRCVTGGVRSGLHFRTAEARSRYYDRLLHSGNVGASQPGLGFSELVGPIGLVIGLHQKFHGEGILLVFFEVSDGCVKLLLIHEQSPSRSVVRTLDDAVATAGSEGLELLQRLIGQRLVAHVRGAHRAGAQNAGEFLISVALGERAVSQRFLGLLQILQRCVIVRLIFGYVPVGLCFLQVLVLGVGGLGNFLK